jgi:alpha-tubulin suppressor-like RCC1 family protein
MKRTLGATGMALAAGLASSLAATSPPVQIAREGTNVVLTFRGDLQHSAQVQGPYTNVTDVASPLRVPWTLASAGFWRARQDAGATLSQYLSAGMDHTVALRKDGSLWAWGLNYDGNLDDGTHTATNSPQRIATNRTWRAVAAGGVLDGRSLAIRSDGTLWAWGDNFWGQLGDGNMFTKTNTPQQIGTNTNWQAIAAGGTHSVGLQADGSLWTWGLNEDGQLGNGTDGPFTNVTTPQRIGTATNWVAVTAGFDHTLALRADGTLWAWGDNGWGQLGIGTDDDANTPQPVLGGAVWGPPPP